MSPAADRTSPRHAMHHASYAPYDARAGCAARVRHAIHTLEFIVCMAGCSVIATACRDVHQLTKLHPSHPAWSGNTSPTFDADDDHDNTVRLHHLQMKGTHNSYHIEPFLSAIPQWQYTHTPLFDQLEHQNVRQFEFDVHYNSRTGHFDVLHKRKLDAETTCRHLGQCLNQLRRWSEQHPDHSPLFIMIEPKDTFSAWVVDTYFAHLERVIRNAWPQEQVITPDNVRQHAPSLAVAVSQFGWPSVAAARGKAIFTLLDFHNYRNAYTYGGQSLANRLMFVSAHPDDPFAAIVLLDDPIGQYAQIQRSVQDGFLVRTRADEDTLEARTTDPTRLRAALASGAHMISTDFPAPVSDTLYWVDLPGNHSMRCNPVTAPTTCKPSMFAYQPIETDVATPLPATSSTGAVLPINDVVDMAARTLAP